MQRKRQAYPVDAVIDSFRLHPNTYSLLYEYSSGNGDGGLKVSLGGLDRFFRDCERRASGLNGQLYTMEQLIKIKIPCPEDAFEYGNKMGGEDVALYVASIIKDLSTSHMSGRLQNDNCMEFLSLFGENSGRVDEQGQSRAAKRTGMLGVDQIWGQFFKTRDEHFRNLLMEHYGPLVKQTAEYLHSKLPDNVEVDDLISAGTFGLMDAIDAFDPARGVKFETYCHPRIRGAILDELREMDWVPRLVRARAHQLNRVTQVLEASLGRGLTEEETAEELCMDAEAFERLRRDASAVGLISLDGGYDDDDAFERQTREIDIIRDKKSQDPLIEAQKRDLKNLLMRGLTRAEQLVVILYYYEDMTMKEIGATIDLTKSRVSQMHSSIINGLKAKLGSKESAQYLPGA